MSRSPAEAVGADEAADYLEAFRTVFRLQEQGKSFSGRERHCAFLNTGTTRFANISATSGLDFIEDGRGLASIDWDADGDLDLWIASRTAPRLRFTRNNTPSHARFLALRLVGTTSNRDAIGARVAVFVDGRRQAHQTRTLRAGEGFLSQSSHWLHFGLGDLAPAAGIDRVVVSWPSGEEETFRNLEPGHRYTLTEGRGQGIEEPTPPAVALEPSTLEPEPSTTPERVLLVGRVPLPPLSYQTFDGTATGLETQRAGPTLINLWASWCLPCVKELRDLTAQSEELERAGLRVLALSVDGLDPDTGTGPADARRFIAERAVPFPSGMASAELLTRLQILHDRLFSLHLPLAIPTSFLIDDRGRLAAIYRGPVDVAGLLADVRRLPVTAEERRGMATPFAGRWLAPPRGLAWTAFAQRFLDRGFTAEAIFYLEAELGTRPDDPHLLSALADVLAVEGRVDDAIATYEKAALADPADDRSTRKSADLLAASGRLREAELAYRRALESSPDSPETHYNLANLLHDMGRTDQAILELRAALELRSDYAAAHNNLAALLLEQGRLEEATVALRRTLELAPELADAHNNLGILLAGEGRLDAAIDEFRQAVALRADYAEAHNNLGAMLMQRGDLEAAIREFRRAVEIRPDYADAADNLSAAERARGR